MTKTGIGCTIGFCFTAHVINGSFLMAGFRCPEYSSHILKQLQIWTGAMSLVFYVGIYYFIKLFKPSVRYEGCCDPPKFVAAVLALIPLVAPILSIYMLVICVKLPEDTTDRMGGILIYSINLVLMLPICDVCRHVWMNYEPEEEERQIVREVIVTPQPPPAAISVTRTMISESTTRINAHLVN